jgi:hypothetical protein
LKKEQVEFLQRLKIISCNLRSYGSPLSTAEILQDIEHVMDELRIRRDEN